MTETVTDVATGTIRSRFDQMRFSARQVAELAGFGLPPTLADIKREAAEAQARYECARIDAYEAFCRKLVPGLLEATRDLHGPDGVRRYLSIGGSEENRALGVIVRKFPFSEFAPELVGL